MLRGQGMARRMLHRARPADGLVPSIEVQP